MAEKNPTPILPEIGQVFAWWDEYGMLDNIRAHSSLVAKVALCLHSWLEEAGVSLRRNLVETGALLHDIAKTPCLGGKCRHDEMGARIMEGHGQPEIARIIRLHVTLPPGNPLDEAMVVNYADKRVKHDAVVNLENRFDYILERYGSPDPEVIKLFDQGRQRGRQVEKLLFQRLGDRHNPLELDELWEQGRL